MTLFPCQSTTSRSDYDKYQAEKMYLGFIHKSGVIDYYVFSLHLQGHYKFQENQVHRCYHNLEGSQQYGVSCWFAQLGWSIFRIHPLRNLKVLRKHME